MMKEKQENKENIEEPIQETGTAIETELFSTKEEKQEEEAPPEGKQEEESPSEGGQGEGAPPLSAIYREGMKRRGKRKTDYYPREIARQQHIARPPAMKSLFDCLTDKAKERAIALDEKDKLLSSLIEGIGGGELSTKVIIALIQELNEQHNLKYDKRKNFSEQIEKTSALIAETIGRGLREVRTAGKVIKSDKVDKDGYPLSICPFIIIKIDDFARRVIGIPANETLNTKNKGNVKDTLDNLRIKEAFYKCDNGHFRSVSLIRGINKDVDPQTEEELWIIELDGIFIRNIENDFIILPADILMRLRGRQKILTMRLFWYLVENYSIHKRTWPIEMKYKGELFSEIAIIDRYKDHPKEKEKDFRIAIEKMKEIRLISSYKEEQAKNGELLCIFTFRDDFRKILSKK